MKKNLKKWMQQLLAPIVREVVAEREKEETIELDVYFVNGTDKGKRTVAVSNMKTATPKEVFIEITNENQGKVTFQQVSPLT